MSDGCQYACKCSICGASTEREHGQEVQVCVECELASLNSERAPSVLRSILNELREIKAILANRQKVEFVPTPMARPVVNFDEYEPAPRPKPFPNGPVRIFSMKDGKVDIQ